MTAIALSIFSSIMTVLGVISAPLISTLINSRYQQKINSERLAHELEIKRITDQHETDMYDRKVYTEHKLKAIEAYLTNIGKFLFGEQYNTNSISEGISTIYIYAPKSLWCKIEEMNRRISDISASDYHALEATKPLYLELCKEFGKYLENLP